MRWRPLTTFLQTLIDMKNAEVTGAYRAWAHDYRPELARFIRDVYGLPASDEELMRIEQALEEREAVRERLFTAPSAGPGIDISHIGSTVPR
jgi:Mn-dependent DtxR family transcriptional regulator